VSLLGKERYESYEWVKIPENLNRSNLVMVIAKTPKSTVHPEDPEYPVRIFITKELYEGARSLAQRNIGINHLAIIPGAFTVDANWNEKNECIEALLYVPSPFIEKIRNREINKVSVEYTWREEKRTEAGVEFYGLVFNRIDLLSGLTPGDDSVRMKLVEGKRGLMEGILEGVETQEAFINRVKVEAIEFTKTLGEPFADYEDWDDCISKNSDKGNPAAYCGYIKAKTEPKKEAAQVPEIPANNLTTIDVVAPAPITQPNPSNLIKLEDNDTSKGGEPIMNDEEKLKHKIESTSANNTTAANPTNNTVVPKPEPIPTPATNPTPEPVIVPAPVVVPTPVIVEPTPPVVTPPAATVPKLDAKDVRIVELETSVTRLQEASKTVGIEKDKAIKEAVEKTKEDIFKKVESVLPPGNIISSMNKGGQKLAEDLRRVLYKEKK